MRIEPIPNHERYDVEYQAASEELTVYGGIRSHLANRALQVKFDQHMAENDLAVAKLGIRFVDESLWGDDEASYDAAYAFTNGFMIANSISDKLYKSPHTIMNRLSPAVSWMDHAPLSDGQDGEGRLQQEIQYLTEFGVYGTRQLGGVALAHLVEWANQAYPDHERSAMMFCLGAGTLVAGAQMYQRQVNAQLIELMDCGEITFDNFIQEIAGDNSNG